MRAAASPAVRPPARADRRRSAVRQGCPCSWRRPAHGRIGTLGARRLGVQPPPSAYHRHTWSAAEESALVDATVLQSEERALPIEHHLGVDYPAGLASAGGIRSALTADSAAEHRWSSRPRSPSSADRRRPHVQRSKDGVAIRQSCLLQRRLLRAKLGAPAAASNGGPDMLAPIVRATSRLPGASRLAAFSSSEPTNPNPGRRAASAP